MESRVHSPHRNNIIIVHPRESILGGKSFINDARGKGQTVKWKNFAGYGKSYQLAEAGVSAQGTSWRYASEEPASGLNEMASGEKQRALQNVT